MKLIKLHLSANDKPVTVNTDNVAYYHTSYDDHKGTMVNFVGGDYVIVSETPEQIGMIIKARMLYKGGK